jgi:hypothetical protein
MRTIPLVALGEKLVNACTASHGVWRSTDCVFVLHGKKQVAPNKWHFQAPVQRIPVYILYVLYIRL